MPKWITTVLICVTILSGVPFALIARARIAKSEKPRIHIIRDMDNQERFKAQQANEMFADGRSMRPPLPGTVARGELKEDDHFYRGIDTATGQWATTFPEDVRPLTREFLERGRKRYEIYCAPCHGMSGYGDGPVALRAKALKRDADTGTFGWADPTNYHDDTIRGKAHGELFNTITHGIRTMPAYASQIPESDRWAIVAWMKAIQRSQNATWDDLPGVERDRLEDDRVDAIEAQRIADEAAAERAAAAAAKEAAGEGANE